MVDTLLTYLLTDSHKGSGKTTLLDVLAGRADACRISGDVLYNEHRFEDNMKTSLAYVEQYVPLYETLTVKEVVLYSAYLRNRCTTNDHTLENEVGYRKDYDVELIAKTRRLM